jgi:hypothetical protein
MTLPKEHLDWLSEAVGNHERRRAQLREGIRLAEEEAAFQEVLLDLAHNDRLIDALGELYEDVSLTSKFARGPLGYCREENIPLPEGVRLRVPNKTSSRQLRVHLGHVARSARHRRFRSRLRYP